MSKQYCEFSLSSYLTKLIIEILAAGAQNINRADVLHGESRGASRRHVNFARLEISV